jgi:hypothetical protein
MSGASMSDEAFTDELDEMIEAGRDGGLSDEDMIVLLERVSKALREGLSQPADKKRTVPREVMRKVAAGNRPRRALDVQQKTGRPSRTWGASRRAPERTAAPPLGDRVIPLKGPIGGRGPNLEHQMSTSW